MAEIGASVPAIVSSSPRKLQEMSIQMPEGHDVTTSSGVSMKQYEEQLSGLRKENFHLKLRVYFLEEKLGSGSPPAVQGLLEHNVRLQVEVEELKRQLADTQELLAAAAQAIDVLEQQGSISTDSVEGSILNNSTILKQDGCNVSQEQDIDKINQTSEDTCQETDGDTLIQITNDETSELERLRRENRKALEMIKSCFKKIHQQEKELKKLKKINESGHANGEIIEKYEKLLSSKEELINSLECKVKELQQMLDDGSNDNNTGNLQQLLTRRLQGLAYFLDKLLSHKCVLGEDKKKLAESILEQSLALPVGLKLDESMAPGDLTMDESNLDISHSLRIDDLTLMFGHHLSCGEGLKKRQMKQVFHPQVDAMSESECWSEPDRNVSLARMGLQDRTMSSVGAKESISDVNRHRARRSRVSHGSRSDETKPHNESLYLEEISQLTRRIEHLEGAESELTDELTKTKERVAQLMAERDELSFALNAERAKVEEITSVSHDLTLKIQMTNTQISSLEQQVSNAVEVSERLRAEKQELEATFQETERCLRRAADEAAVQASQAVLERAREHNDRLRVERDLENARDKLTAALDTNSHLQLQISNRITLEANNKIQHQELLCSEEDRPTSPDQGIDSDRLSSLEHTDALSRSPRSLYEENACLKQKLSRAKATLADTLTQLNAANMRKKSVQRAICREIHKTHGVLRQARDQLEQQHDDKIKPFKET